jgi:hypothetical protein
LRCRSRSGVASCSTTFVAFSSLLGVKADKVLNDGRPCQCVAGRKGEPPAGYLRTKDAEAALQALLTDARRGASEQRRPAVTLDVIADEWLAWCP